MLREEREWGVGSGYGVFGLVAERGGPGDWGGLFF